MKNSRSFVVILLLAAFLASCTSRPAVSRPVTGPSVSAGSAMEYTELFERALRDIKMNSPLVKKYFEPREVIVSGAGYKSVEDIVLKGEYQIGGNEFVVTYDLASAFKSTGTSSGGTPFRISFNMKDPTNGVSHDDVLLWNPVENESGLLLSFDDDYFDVWRKYFDLFDFYGAKVTFFVQGSLEPGLSSALDKGLAGFCAEALRRGHSLGFHSVNHLDLTKVSPETFQSETVEAAAVFLREGISFSAFAYPFGLSQTWMHEALAPVFPLTRGYGRNIRIYNSKTFSGRYIVSKAIDNTIYPDDRQFENDIRLILLAAKFSGSGIVPLTTHQFSETAEWGIKPSRLEFLLKTAQELRLKFYTYGEIRPTR